MLADLLRKLQLPESWVGDVSITIDFNTIAEDAQLQDCPALGEPFKCLCKIIDDYGRLYIYLNHLWPVPTTLYCERIAIDPTTIPIDHQTF